MTASQIEDRIKSEFPNCEVLVMDQTGGGNHFEIRMSAKEFVGLSRVAQQRKVMDVFSEELKTGEIHALSMKLIPA